MEHEPKSTAEHLAVIQALEPFASADSGVWRVCRSEAGIDADATIGGVQVQVGFPGVAPMALARTLGVLDAGRVALDAATIVRRVQRDVLELLLSLSPTERHDALEALQNDLDGVADVIADEFERDRDGVLFTPEEVRAYSGGDYRSERVWGSVR